MDEREVQSLKASLSMVVTLLGIVTEAREVQPEKVLFFISVALLGIATDDSNPH